MNLLMHLLCTKQNFDYWSKFTMFDFFYSSTPHILKWREYCYLGAYILYEPLFSLTNTASRHRGRDVLQSCYLNSLFPVMWTKHTSLELSYLF